MGEKLGCEIDNSEILGEKENFGDKILKQNILNKIMKNSNSTDYSKNYDYFNSLDSEKINILNNLSDSEFKVIQELLMTEGNESEKLFSNLKKIKENNIKFSAVYFGLILDKISKNGLTINEKHIKILKNNSNFFYKFIEGEINNGTKEQININFIIKIIDLFDKYHYKIPKKFLSSTFIFSEDIEYIEESLKIAKNHNINDKHLRYFLGLRANKDLYKKIDNKFLDQSEYWPTWQGDKNFNKYLKLILDKGFLYVGNDGGGLLKLYNVIKAKKEKLKTLNFSKIKELFGNLEIENYYYHLDEDISKNKNGLHRLGSILGEQAMISKNIINDYNDFKKKGLLKNISFEEFKEMVAANEIMHSNLEKIGYKMDGGAPYFGKDISSDYNIYIHEFLSDVSSLSVNKKYFDLMLVNYFDFNEILFNDNKFESKSKGIYGTDGYNYIFDFITKTLNNLVKEGDLKIKGNNIKEIKENLFNNLTEEDYNYIQAEFIKQGKIWIKDIKNLNLKEKK